jgi:hypothetical protein
MHRFSVTFFALIRPLLSKMPTANPGGSRLGFIDATSKEQRTSRLLGEKRGAKRNKNSANPHASPVTSITLFRP